MNIFHLIDSGEVNPAPVTRLLYGRCTAETLNAGKLVCDNHLFTLDTDNPPDPGEKLLIWRAHDFFCCKVTDYESIYQQ